MIDFSEIKNIYPQPKNTTYLNTSSSGLVSKNSIAKAQLFNDGLHDFASGQAENFLVNEIPKVRKVISEFMDASIDEIALIPNFSFGLNAVIPSIKKLKRVLLFRDDYPSLTMPFTLNNFQVHWLESKNGFDIKMEDIIDSIIVNKIQMVAISHVQWLTGFSINLEQLSYICKSQHVLLVLDGTQSLGAIPFSFKPSGVNIFITSNYKWMNGGYGTGIMCIDHETQEEFPPKIGGLNSYKYIDKEWKYTPSINSYEPGHPNMAGISVLKEAIEFKLRIGVDHICSHNNKLIKLFTEKIDQTSFELIGPNDNKNRSNIVGIRGDKELEKFLINHGIIVKWRNGIIRIGMHFYNTEDDVNRIIQVLESYTELHSSSTK